MHSSAELAEFAVEEFRRGLEGLADEEALFRAEKADGTQLNAISWTVQHIASHWRNVGQAARGLPLVGPHAARDGSPLPYAQSLALLDNATDDLNWVSTVGDEAMTRQLPEFRGESVGMFLARAVMHTWFHTGEINAVRQLLGHAEIRFVGDIAGRLDWIAGGNEQPGVTR